MKQILNILRIHFLTFSNSVVNNKIKKPINSSRTLIHFQHCRIPK